MKKHAIAFALAAALLVTGAGPSFARGHGGGGSHGGGGFHGGGMIHASGGPHAGWHGGPSMNTGWHGGGGGHGWHGGGGHWHDEHWHGGWYGGVYIGGPWWWGGPYYAYPYGYYGYPYAYPYPYYGPYPSAADPGPTMYVQRPVTSEDAPPDAFWYYCPSSKAYYPTVSQCREEWIKVPPVPSQ
ncbi:MAG TPA: hypothetical protein VMT89_18380 [Candidatus Acidoferrales bacterium]|nr:hypothetical protein [Candidatus Acidoferrales bacterium]